MSECRFERSRSCLMLQMLGKQDKHAAQSCTISFPSSTNLEVGSFGIRESTVSHLELPVICELGELQELALGMSKGHLGTDGSLFGR